MPDVVEIVLQLLDCVLIALAVRVIHLRPPGDPRFHQMPEMIRRYLFLISLGAPDPFRAWTNQAHVALKDIPKLRQLIEPQFPQPAPSTRHAQITFACVEIGRLLSRRLVRVARSEEYTSELQSRYH